MNSTGSPGLQRPLPRPDRSLEEFGADGLAALLQGAEIGDRQIIDVFNCMTHPWGARAIGVEPRYRSDASNDSTPYEYSVAFDAGVPEIRFMVEGQGEQANLKSNQIAGQQLTETLGAKYGVSLDRYHAVEDLFCPEEPQGLFTIWHAVCWRPGAGFDFKLYFNPQCRGLQNMRGLVREAMHRLGLEQAYRAAYEDGPRRPSDEMIYFSLDLSASKSARVKVYQRHPGATVEEMEAACSVAQSYTPGDATALYRAMTGHDGPYTAKSMATCLSFTEGKQVPSGATAHVPISAYVPNDLVASERITAYLASQGLPTTYYTNMLRRYSLFPLEKAAGMQSYVSFRRSQGAPRVTVYFGPGAYTGALSLADAAPAHPSASLAGDRSAPDPSARRSASRPARDWRPGPRSME